VSTPFVPTLLHEIRVSYKTDPQKTMHQKTMHGVVKWWRVKYDAFKHHI
jgi:hypothetical protein